MPARGARLLVTSAAAAAAAAAAAPPPPPSSWRISELLSATPAAAAAAPPPLPGAPVALCGWVRSVRHQKAYSFMELNDGSSARNLQVLWRSGDAAVQSAAERRGANTGAFVRVEGALAASPRPQQPLELHASRVALLGASDAEQYPLQKKAHGAEFLRELAHLRPRTSRFAAVLRVRDTLQAALHATLRADGCVGVSTPLLTSNDCEGGGELFAVLPASELAAGAAGGAPPPQHSSGGGPPTPLPPPPPAARFFGKPVFLTVSGQLHLEAFACALGRVYAFGPTFRAEHSHTPRHAAEFWMLEPELAPGRMGDAMALAERCVRAALGAVLAERGDDLAFLSTERAAAAGDAADDAGGGGIFGGAQLLPRLQAWAAGPAPYARMSYTRAVQLLSAPGAPAFSSPVVWGAGLPGDAERHLAEAVVGGPVFVTHYPAAIKPFYMKASGADAEEGEEEAPGCAALRAGRPTVQAFDLLMPGLGELAGGSAREDDHDALAARMAAGGLLSPARAAAVAAGAGATAPPADCRSPFLDWYLDLRRFGSPPHAGFGLGFERLVMLATGTANIRDVLPVPRVPDSCRM